MMTKGAQQEVAGIKAELRSIIIELESIRNGVKRDFQGIGNENCAKSIDSVILQYKNVLRKLDNMDTRTLSKHFKSIHPELADDKK